MSVTVNILKVRRVFADKNSQSKRAFTYTIALSNLGNESELTLSDLSDVIDVLEESGIIEPVRGFADFITISEPYRELMGVS
ncbi:MAG: hypothetical protein G01um101444_445 [Parcubacteria group bacterium Gr01-1014_44]|nr:MAG: hypothetical protein G01um101444_445 [Parcubacteria group bacterium Gr01-1014_44]